MNKTTILYITDNGLKLAERLKAQMPGAELVKFSTDLIADVWGRSDALVFIMAAGIVVRTIAPLLRDKKTDPAVVVIDDTGKHVISLVGGHLGGANELAKEIAGLLGGDAVITTASDVNGLPAVDLWARENDLVIENEGLLPLIGTRLVNSWGLRVYSDEARKLPDAYLRVAEARLADVIITNRRNAYGETPETEGTGDKCTIDTCRVKGQLYLRPQNLVLGIGCNSGTSKDEIESFVRKTLDANNLAFLSVGALATIDIKGTEPGLKAFAGQYSLPLRTFTAGELNRVDGIEQSETVFKATGAHAVAEPAAILASGAGKLLVPKQKKGNVTVAIAVKKSEVRSQKSEENKGRIFIVGTGPGKLEHITPAARMAIEMSNVIVGYGTYLDLIKELIRDKEVVETGMTQEVDRGRKAIELALSGKTVSVISGGDPGVYAMAGLVFELMKSAECGVWNAEYKTGKYTKQALRTPHSTLRIEVIPGISALNAAAARLGAPLMHDFACISLSDRLTPWEMIEKRLDAASAADFVIVLYNPRSKGRAGHLARTRDIILKHRPPSTVVGIVKGAMRDNEKIIVTDLGNMNVEDVDMQTTVIIGNSKTFAWNNLMITPRGYEVP